MTTPVITKRPIAGMSDVARLDRAMAALRFTARNSPHAGLRRLALMKYWEAAAQSKLATCGYRVRYDRTDPRSVY